MDECFTCAQEADLDGAGPGERLWVGRRWRVAQAVSGSEPHWLVVVPRRHVTAIASLTPAESADLGPLLVGASAALTEVTGCVKTYVAQFAEADGFSHVHFHVVPRMSDQPVDRRGPAVFSRLTEALPPGVDRDAAVGPLREALFQALSVDGEAGA